MPYKNDCFLLRNFFHFKKSSNSMKSKPFYLHSSDKDCQFKSFYDPRQTHLKHDNSIARNVLEKSTVSPLISSYTIGGRQIPIGGRQIPNEFALVLRLRLSLIMLVDWSFTAIRRGCLPVGPVRGDRRKSQ